MDGDGLDSVSASTLFLFALSTTEEVELLGVSTYGVTSELCTPPTLSWLQTNIQLLSLLFLDGSDSGRSHL